MGVPKPSKIYLREWVKEFVKKNNDRDVKILELGCGRAEQLFPIVSEFKNVEYVGFEPKVHSIDKARKLYQGIDRASFLHKLAYGGEEDFKNFDIVVSMSVLEHVKHLKPLLDFSVASARAGGHIIHLYDLGHTLYPINFKEKIHTMLCNNSLSRLLIPETKITGNVDLEEVKKILLNSGVLIERVTYHNVRSLVAYIKARYKEVTGMEDSEVLELANFEIKLAEKLGYSKRKEKIFPSVCVWARKS